MRLLRNAPDAAFGHGGAIAPPADTVLCGDLALDRQQERVTLAGQELTLTEREFDLLMVLIDSSHRAVGRSELLAQVWGAGAETGSNVLDVYVARLRKKLGAHAAMLLTLRGFGYRLRPHVAR